MRKNSAPRSIFRKSVLDNGLTLITEEVDSFHSLSMGVWVKVGTRHESPKEAGVSHFLEHMLFKGTRSRTALQIAREVDGAGGDFNAFTTREHTCFHLLLLNRDASLGFDILNDVLLNSQFDVEEFERERKVILQEIAMVDESPEECVHDLFYEKIYANHGLGRPILGTEASIRKLKRVDLVNYFRHHYRPEQLVFSVAGNVSHAKAKREIERFNRRVWPGRTRSNPVERGRRSSDALSVTMPSDVPRVVEGKWSFQRRTEQTHLIWGVEAPHYASPERYAANVLNTHLGGGMSSLLFQEIREKHGLAYTVYSAWSPYADTGVFAVYAGTSPKQVGLCLKLIEECANRVAKKGLSKKELEAAKNNMKGMVLLSADNVESRMSSIARSEIHLRRHLTIEEVCQRFDQVTADDVQALAARLFSSGRRSIVALGER